MKSLKMKLLVLFIPILLAIFTVMSTISYFSANKIIKERKEAELFNFISAEKNIVEGWLSTNLNIIGSVHRTLEKGFVAPELELNYLMNNVKQSPAISDIYIGTTEGEMIDGSGWIPPADYDPRKRPWYPEGLKNSEPVYGSPYVDMVTGQVAVSASVKLMKPSGELRGVISGDVLLNSISEQVSKIKYGETGYAYIFNTTDEKIMAHSNKDLIGKTLMEIDPSLGELSKEFTKTEDGTLTYKVGGDKKNAVHVYLPELKWNLVMVLSEKEVLKEAKIFRNKITLIGLISFIVLIILIERISASIVSPIKKLEKSVVEISAGNLNTEINVKGKDEIAKLSIEFNAFVAKLKSTMLDIKAMASRVEESNTTLRKSMDNLIKGKNSGFYSELTSDSKVDKGIVQLVQQADIVLDNVRDQTASTEESLAALEEISATSHHMNENMEATGKTFDETRKIAMSSGNDINKMSDSMGDITVSVGNTNEEIETLKELSNNIGDILTAINSIAEQTNLLALNAAIEAARAGEAGRGFSVVADEIRKLAEQTNKETGKIETLIDTVQGSVEKVRSGGDNVKIKVDEGLSLSKVSEENINTIVESISQNTESLIEIIDSVKEQSSAAQEITSAISTISNNSTEIEQMSIGMTQISNLLKDILVKKQGEVEENANLAKQLSEDLEFFKTDN